MKNFPLNLALRSRNLQHLRIPLANNIRATNNGIFLIFIIAARQMGKVELSTPTLIGRLLSACFPPLIRVKAGIGRLRFVLPARSAICLYSGT